MLKVEFEYKLTDNECLKVKAYCSDINCYAESEDLKLIVKDENDNEAFIPDMNVLDDIELEANEKLYEMKYENDLNNLFQEV